MDLIISHNACPDGFCAAYIASKRYPEAQIMFRDHGLEPPYEAVTGKDVLVTDFSWRTREQNDKMASLAKSFRILDHHKTAEAVLAGAPYATFDMNRSGAGLAWDYLFGRDSWMISKTREERPWWVNYVEARDLWRWESLHNSREICAYLGTLPFTKEGWDAITKEPMELGTIIDLGKGALAHIEHYTREAIKQAKLGKLMGYKVAVLNVPYLNCSEVGNELAKTYDVSLTWFERGDGIIQFSLRSIGDKDVSEIAKKFNGGGHKNASGFQLPLQQGRDTIDAILGRGNYVSLPI